MCVRVCSSLLIYICSSLSEHLIHISIWGGLLCKLLALDLCLGLSVFVLLFVQAGENMGVDLWLCLSVFVFVHAGAGENMGYNFPVDGAPLCAF